MPLQAPARSARRHFDLYEVFFSGDEVDIREVDAAVVEKATEVRAIAV